MRDTLQYTKIIIYLVMWRLLTSPYHAMKLTQVAQLLHLQTTFTAKPQALAAASTNSHQPSHNMRDHLHKLASKSISIFSKHSIQSLENNTRLHAEPGCGAGII